MLDLPFKTPVLRLYLHQKGPTILFSKLHFDCKNRVWFYNYKFSFVHSGLKYKLAWWEFEENLSKQFLHQLWASTAIQHTTLWNNYLNPLCWAQGTLKWIFCIFDDYRTISSLNIHITPILCERLRKMRNCEIQA